MKIRWRISFHSRQYGNVTSFLSCLKHYKWFQFNQYPGQITEQYAKNTLSCNQIIWHKEILLIQMYKDSGLCSVVQGELILSKVHLASRFRSYENPWGENNHDTNIWKQNMWKLSRIWFKGNCININGWVPSIERSNQQG